MYVLAGAMMINVPDPDASADFLVRHLHFTHTMNDDGLAVVSHTEAGLRLAFLRVGQPDFVPASVAGPLSKGMIIVIVITGIDVENARLQDAGVEIVTPLHYSPWANKSGERYLQVRDPNGIVIRLTEWV